MTIWLCYRNENTQNINNDTLQLLFEETFSISVQVKIQLCLFWKENKLDVDPRRDDDASPMTSYRIGAC